MSRTDGDSSAERHGATVIACSIEGTDEPIDPDVFGGAFRRAANGPVSTACAYTIYCTSSPRSS
jgi:hypothetical protein